MRFVLLAALSSALAFSQQYRVTGSIPIGGSGGWDYLTADNQNHRLYVSHAGNVEVIDLDTNKPIAKISGMSRIHGIAIADDLNRGFISDGGNNEVVLFDLKTNTVKSKVKAGTNPDGIVYDPASKRVFAFNGGSHNATAINAETGKVDATVALAASPSFLSATAKGTSTTTSKTRMKSSRSIQEI